MKIIISHKGIKRIIDGTGFDISGDTNVLRRIGIQLLETAKDRNHMTTTRIEVRDDEHTVGDAVAIPWGDEVREKEEMV